MLKEFFGHNEGTIINPTNSGEFPDGDKFMTDGYETLVIMIRLKILQLTVVEKCVAYCSGDVLP